MVSGELTLEKVAEFLRRDPGGIEFGIQTALEQLASNKRENELRELQNLTVENQQNGRIADAEKAKQRYDELRSRPLTSRLVLVVDQLEEVFTLKSVTHEMREGFVIALAALARSGRVYLLATLRSDFFARCAELPLLAELSQGEGLYHLLPPDPSEIAAKVWQPALLAGLQFETHPQTGESLDDRLRDAAIQQPESLPLLEFCLEELYKGHKRRGDSSGLLTFVDYEAMGGVEGALAKRAEEIFLDLSSEAQAQFDHVMRGITSVGLGELGKFTRRWADLGKLIQPPGAKEFVEAFLAPEARLFVVGRNDDGQAVVSATHEALLHRWDRLQNWLLRNRENLLMRSEVAADAQRWEENGRNADYLYPDGLPLREGQEITRRRLSRRQSARVCPSWSRARSVNSTKKT